MLSSIARGGTTTTTKATATTSATTTTTKRTISSFENQLFFFPCPMGKKDSVKENKKESSNMRDDPLSSTSTISSAMSISNQNTINRNSNSNMTTMTTNTSLMDSKNTNNNNNYHQLMKDLSSKDWTEKYRTTHVDIDLKHTNLFSSSASESSSSTALPASAASATVPTIPAAPTTLMSPAVASASSCTKSNSATGAIAAAPIQSSISSLFSLATSSSFVSNHESKNNTCTTDDMHTDVITTTNSSNHHKDVDYEAEYCASLGVTLSDGTAMMNSQPTPTTSSPFVMDSAEGTITFDHHAFLNTMMNHPKMSRSRTSSLGSVQQRWSSLSRSSSLSKSSNNNNNTNNSTMENSLDDFKMSVDINVFMTPSMDAQMKIIHEEGKAIAAAHTAEQVFSSSSTTTTSLVPNTNTEAPFSNHLRHRQAVNHKDTEMENLNDTDPSTPDIATSGTSTNATAPPTTRRSSNIATTDTTTESSPARNLDASIIVNSMDTVSAILKLADEIKAANDEDTTTITTLEKNNGTAKKNEKSVKQQPPRINKKRARRTREPEQKEYVDPQPTDVLLGRGGRSNHHKGNKEYRDKVGELRVWYRSSEKNTKTDLSQMLVDWVHNEQKGRFLKMESATTKDDQWYIVTNIVARRKASQALREHMFPEEREAKKKEREKVKKHH